MISYDLKVLMLLLCWLEVPFDCIQLQDGNVGFVHNELVKYRGFLFEFATEKNNASQAR